MSQAPVAHRPDAARRLRQSPKPPGRSLMSVRGNAAPRGMTAVGPAHMFCERAWNRIRLTGPFAECSSSQRPGPEKRFWLLGWSGKSSLLGQQTTAPTGTRPVGADHFRSSSGIFGRVLLANQADIPSPHSANWWASAILSEYWRIFSQTPITV